MGRKKIDAWGDVASDIDKMIDVAQKQVDGTVRYEGARKDWDYSTCQREMDVTIEDLIADDYYLGSYNIWPAIRDEIIDIWHKRCDFTVRIIRDGEVLKQDTIYALSFEHAKRKAQEKWPRQIAEATGVEVYRDENIHTICLELPKGTGKDFEMSLIMWLLIREYLIMDRREFFKPYNLDLDTTIAVILMNRTEEQARDVTFKEILPRVRCPFFLDYFPPHVDLEEIENTRRYPRELRFPRNVVLFPGTGAAASGLGYCVASSCIDEANFMAKSATSKQSIYGSDSYDAAQEAYNDLFQRKESCFGALRNGIMTYAGFSIVISSSRTQNDFTQVLGRRSLKNDGIYYKRIPFWERKPLNLSGRTFDFDVTNQQILNVKTVEKEHQELRAIPDNLQPD